MKHRVHEGWEFEEAIACPPHLRLRRWLFLFFFLLNIRVNE